MGQMVSPTLPESIAHIFGPDAISYFFGGGSGPKMCTIESGGVGETTCPTKNQMLRSIERFQRSGSPPGRLWDLF